MRLAAVTIASLILLAAAAPNLAQVEGEGGACVYGNSYEIASWGTGAISARQALAGWQRSAAHNAVITEQGIWPGARWKAMGVGVATGYGVVWLGKEPDLTRN